MTHDELLKHAAKAKQTAYAPYSHFRVGAALLGESGRVYTGANIENASYSVTCCAERVALFKAVSEGEKAFSAIAITSDAAMPTYPCGVCRQALIEFSPQMDVLASDEKLEYKKTKLESLLPCAFTGKEMET